MEIHQERIGWGRTHRGQFDWGNSPGGNSSHPNSNINYNLHSQPDFVIYSCFMSSMWTSERQSDNWGKQGNHHCSWGFWEESIEEAKGKYSVKYIFVNITTIIWISCYELSKLVKVMADKTNNKNSAEKPVEVSLKTTSDFYSPSNLHQPQESCQDHFTDGHWWKSTNYMFFKHSWEIYCKTGKHYG